MRLPIVLIALIFLAFFSVSLPAQTLPDGFIFDNSEKFVYQVLPDHELIPRQVAEYGNFQAVGISTQVLEGLFAVAIVNALPEKGDPIFKKQKDHPILITADGEKIVAGTVRTVAEKKAGKAKYEVVVVQIFREDFEKILAANKLYIEFGKFTHLASAENLKAIHYLSDRLEKDELPESSGTYSSNEIHVRGYYRKDGTYVRPHTRRRPKN